MEQGADFSKAFDSMRSGVYVVTSVWRRKPAGCTVVWLSRASFEPPLLAVNLSPLRHTMRTIERSRKLCVNVLGESGLALARHFGFVSGAETDKFRDVAYQQTQGGCPLLAAAVAYLDCRVEELHSAGDHTLVLARVVEAAVVKNERPLVYDPAAFYPGEAARLAAQHLHHGHGAAK